MTKDVKAGPTTEHSCQDEGTNVRRENPVLHGQESGHVTDVLVDCIGFNVTSLTKVTSDHLEHEVDRGRVAVRHFFECNVEHSREFF